MIIDSDIMYIALSYGVVFGGLGSVVLVIVMIRRRVLAELNRERRLVLKGGDGGG